MSKLSDIYNLLIKVASHVKDGSAVEDSEDCTRAISLLNRSLNCNDIPKTRVLDTVLSLMCFNSQEVQSLGNEVMLQTIVTLMSSATSCNVIRDKNEKDLQIGSSISMDQCLDMIIACFPILRSLERHGGCFHQLLCASLELATTSSCYYRLSPSLVVREDLSEEEIDKTKTVLSQLFTFLPKELFVNDSERPLRLLLWELDPLILKHDITTMLHEFVQNPFLCLKIELKERLRWRSILLNLAVSPPMFIEAMTLLHRWFLLRGLAPIQEFKAELVSSLLDVLSRPMSWGMREEMGLHLPFYHAYFHAKQKDLLSILSGAISRKTFLELVHHIKEFSSLSKNNSSVTSFERSNNIMGLHSAEKAQIVDHKSTWAMLMDFPAWFYLAATLLFDGKFSKHFTSKTKSETTRTAGNSVLDLEIVNAASTFLGWIFDPIDESHRSTLIDSFQKMSESWATNCKENGSFESKSFFSNRNEMKYRKKLMKPRVNIKKCHTNKEVYSIVMISSWLNDFNIFLEEYYHETVMEHSSTKTQTKSDINTGLLFRKIPLGIFFGCLNYLDEEGCELLFEYAVTGAVSLPKDEVRGKATSIETKFEYKKDEKIIVIKQLSLIFKLFHIMENLFTSVYEDEIDLFNHIFMAKSKMCKYVVEHCKKLMQLLLNEECNIVILRDLHKSLSIWKKQGGELFDGFEIVDNVLESLKIKISSLSAVD